MVRENLKNLRYQYDLMMIMLMTCYKISDCFSNKEKSAHNNAILVRI